MNAQAIEQLEAEIENVSNKIEALKIAISENDGGLEDYAREELEIALRRALATVTTGKA